MFKDKKIKEFIEKYAVEFANHNYAELAVFLREIEDINKLIPRINKLSGHELDYVLTTIVDYKRFNFDKRTVNLILNHKLDLINKFGSHRECPNLDKIYYALVPNETLYIMFVKDYIDNHITRYEYKKGLCKESISLEDYDVVLEKEADSFHNLLDQCGSTVRLKTSLLRLPPHHLERFLKMTNDYTTHERKKKVYNYFVGNGNISYNIGLLSIDDFNEGILNFLFTFNDTENINDMLSKKLGLLSEIFEISDTENTRKVNRALLNNLLNIPNNYISMLNNETKDMHLYFLEMLADENLGKELVAKIKEIPRECDEQIHKLVTSNFFDNLEDDAKIMVLDHIQNGEDINLNILEEKIKYLEETEHFNIYPINSYVLAETLKFIKKDTDLTVLKAKFSAIEHVLKQVEYNEASVDDYKKYLEILSNGLEEKNSYEKVKLLSARSKYFENNELSKVIKHATPGIIDFIWNENSSKRMEENYRFIEVVDMYEPEVVQMAIDRLSNFQSAENAKMFVDYITTLAFVVSDLDRQKTLLNLFAVEKETVKVGSNMEVVVSDLSYVENMVSDSSKPLEFTNEATGLKIIVKSNKNSQKN